MGRIIPKKISDIVLNIHKKRGNKIYLNTFIKEVVKKDKYYVYDSKTRELKGPRNVSDKFTNNVIYIHIIF